MWEKIKKFSIENPSAAIAAVSVSLIALAFLIKFGIVAALLVIGVGGLVGVFVAWLMEL